MYLYYRFINIYISFFLQNLIIETHNIKNQKFLKFLQGLLVNLRNYIVYLLPILKDTVFVLFMVKIENIST